MRGVAIVMTEELYNQAEGLAARFVSKKEIAAVLGMGESTLYERLEKDERFRDCFSFGRGKGVVRIKTRFFDKAETGDNHCMTLILKSYSDLKDKTDANVNVGITLNITEADADLA